MSQQFVAQILKYCQSHYACTPHCIVLVKEHILFVQLRALFLRIIVEPVQKVDIIFGIDSGNLCLWIIPRASQETFAMTLFVEITLFPSTYQTLSNAWAISRIKAVMIRMFLINCRKSFFETVLTIRNKF